MDRDVAAETQLAPPLQAWVGELRALWAATGMSMAQFAAINPIDKGTISRYLNGKRVPRDPWFLESLLAILAENGKEVTGEVHEHLTQLQLEALQAAHPAEYRVRLVSDELELTVAARRDAEHYARVLEEQLADRNYQIDELAGGETRRRRPHLAAQAAPVLSAISIVLIVIFALLVSHVINRPGVRPGYSPPPTSSAPICATGSLQFFGSPVFMPIVQEAAATYMLNCPGATIKVSGGDSASGLTRVQDAVTSGSSTAGSIIAMYDGSPTGTAGLSTYPMGVLIFSVVAHTGLFPAGSITTSELRNIFVNPGEQGLVAVGRRAGDGSRKAFITNVLGLNPGPLVPDKGNCPVPTGSTVSFRSCTEDSTADLLNFVNGTPNAIGYAEVFRPPAGYPQVSVLSIDNVRPTRENVLNGSYKFWIAEHLYAAAHPALLTEDFLRFLPHFIQSNLPSDFIACSDALKRLSADC